MHRGSRWRRRPSRLSRLTRDHDHRTTGLPACPAEFVVRARRRCCGRSCHRSPGAAVDRPPPSGPASERRQPPGPAARRTAPAAKRTAANTGAARVPGTGTWRRQVYAGLAGRREYFVYVPRGLGRGRVPLSSRCTAAARPPSTSRSARGSTSSPTGSGSSSSIPSSRGASTASAAGTGSSGRTRAGRIGEPAILAGIVEQVLHRRGLRTDPARVYLAGLSAGGRDGDDPGRDLPGAVGRRGHPFGAAAAIRPRVRRTHSARCRARRRCPPRRPGARALPPTIVFQGRDDAVVRPVNAERIAQQWIDYHARRFVGPPTAFSVLRGCAWCRPRSRRPPAPAADTG